VCDNLVDAEYATIKEEFQNTTFYFCSEVCKERFQLDPGKYVALNRETAA
jgi:YHS domain-containing protein